MAKRKSKKRSSSVSKKFQIGTMNHMTKNSIDSSSCCGYDMKGMGWVFLILGILYLFTDLQWISWWNISWWTIIFLIWGIKLIKK